MTKAELLKLLEPFPSDMLIVLSTGFDWVDRLVDVQDVSTGNVSINPKDGELKYVEARPDLEAIPAIFIE